MIYIIHGKDTFRSHKKLSGFISQAKKQGVEVFDFDFSDDLQVPILFQQLAQSFSSKGIFFTKKTIIIRHIIKLSPAHITFLIKLFKQRVQSHIVLFFESSNIPTSHRLYKKLQTLPEVKVESYSPLTKKQLQAYTKKRFEEEGKTIKDRDVISFLEKSGEDLYAVNLSIIKICLVFPSQTNIDSTCFTCLDIDQEEPFFSLAENIFTGNIKNYLTTLNRLEQRGEDPLKILGYIRSQVRKALILKEASRQEQELHTILGGSPYALKILQKNIASVPEEKIRKYFLEISNIDRKVKFEGKNTWHELARILI